MFFLRNSMFYRNVFILEKNTIWKSVVWKQTDIETEQWNKWKIILLCYSGLSGWIRDVPGIHEGSSIRWKTGLHVLPSAIPHTLPYPKIQFRLHVRLDDTSAKAVGGCALVDAKRYSADNTNTNSRTAATTAVPATTGSNNVDARRRRPTKGTGRWANDSGFRADKRTKNNNQFSFTCRFVLSDSLSSQTII